MPIQRQNLFDPPPAIAPSHGGVEFYGDLSARLQRFSNAATEMAVQAASKDRQRALKVYSAGARSELRLKIDEAEQQHQYDEAALGKALDDVWRKFVRESDADMSPFVEPAFQDLATSARLRTRERFRRQERAQVAEEYELDLTQLSTDAVRFAREGQDDAAFRAMDELRDRIAAGLEPGEDGEIALDASKSEEFLQGTVLDFQEALVLGDMERLPRGEWPAFIKAFRAKPPEHMTAPTVERTLKRLADRVSQHDRIVAIETAERDAQAARDDALRLSELELGIAAGQLDERDIDQAWQAGIVPSAAKRTELYKELKRQRQEAESNAAGMALVQSHMAAGVPLDFNTKEDRELVDSYYSASGIDPFTPDGRAQLTYMVKRVQVIPAPVRSQMRALLRSGEVNQAVAASELLADLVDAAPMVSDQLGETEKAFGRQVNHLVNAGTVPQRAVELVRHQVYEQSPAEREQLAEQYRAVQKDNASKLSDFIDDDLDSLFTLQPEATAALLGEFDASTRSYFLLTRDAETAREAAWSDLRSVWGVSTVNGDREIMKYPPELRGVSRDMLDHELEEAGLPTEGVRIVADRGTARDGSYALVRMTDGLPAPVLNAQNQPARWYPERVVTQAMQKNIEQARAVRAMKERFDNPTLRDQLEEDYMR